MVAKGPGTAAGPVISAMGVAMATVVLLYVLLLGPAVWLHTLGIWEEQIEIAYAPLQWVDDRTGLLEPVLGSYVELWMPDSPAPPPPAAPVAAPMPAGS